MSNLTFALIGLALSAFFSASELAFISANPLQLEVWRKKNRRGARSAMALLGEPQRWLITVLVGTTVANVVTASFATVYLYEAGWHPLASLAIITGVVLLFGEVLPKTIAGERPNQILRLTAPVGQIWSWLLRPFSYPLDKFDRASDQGNHSGPGQTPERDDLKLLFSRQQDPHVLQRNEKELIKQLFEFGEQPISKAMTPRTEIAAVEDTDDLVQVAHAFIESGYSKLPVYHDNLDTISGVIYLYDLFKDPPSLVSIIRPVTLVPDSNTTFAVLRQLQQDERSIAIILDEFGGTAGLATMEDIFEEMFGDFEDEFDDADADIVAAADGSHIIQGRVRIEDLANQTKIALPEGDYETLAGYITTHLGRIPHTGERISLPHGTVVIKKSTPRQIVQAQLWPPGKGPSGKDS